MDSTNHEQNHPTTLENIKTYTESGDSGKSIELPFPGL